VRFFAQRVGENDISLTASTILFAGFPKNAPPNPTLFSDSPKTIQKVIA
jgi:hypothetical protein